MHRVELKVGWIALAVGALIGAVPNAPCGVERWIVYQRYNGGDWVIRECRRAGSWEWEKCPQFCRRGQVCVWKVGAECKQYRSACEINYQYSLLIYRYADKYRRVEDGRWRYW